MIKEALEYLAKLQTPVRPVTVKIDGEHYSVRENGTLGDVVRPVDVRLLPAPIQVSTLSGLVAAVRAKVDELPERVGIHIDNPFRVVVKALDSDELGAKQLYAIATHTEVNAFPFDKYLDPEDFMIAFRRTFIYTEMALNVVELCATIGAASGVAVADDGMSQEVTVKSGTITRSTVKLPADGIPLLPVRTFRDANPVEAKFLLRMKGVKDKLPQVALFEIDPMWSLHLVGSVRNYLQAELPDAIIIA